MPQPADVRALDDELRRIFADAWDEVEELERQLLEGPATARRRRRLEEMRQRVEQLMDDVDKDAEAWVRRRLPEVYGRGAQGTLAFLGYAEDVWSWTTPHMNAIRNIAADMYDDVLSATRYVRRDAKRFIREVARERIGSKLTLGQTAVRTGREIETLLRERGIHAIKYSDGSLHGLREYGQMLSRTKTAQAYNQGTLNQGKDLGVKFYEILDGPDCGLSFHEDPTLANGMIVEREVAEKFYISHPNCRRTFAPRPDITSKSEAREGKPLVTAEQTEDIRRVDAIRGELRRRSRLSRRGRSRAVVSRRSSRAKAPDRVPS